MKTYLKELFAYHDAANHLVQEILFPEKAELNEYAYKMFTHIIMTQHVWQHRILKLPFDHPFWVILPLDDLSKLIVKNKTELETILKDMELEQIINYTAISSPDPFQSKLLDILTHVSHHSSYHRGQIAKSIRDAGLEPPRTDLILWRRV
ncbi:MAG: hypothetical protein IPM34_14060 [Saprospiraceae bacterium]|nr:hypothetical protein [Saprospiraceae bacterium]